MAIYLIRHGHTENIDGEAKLSDKGELQSESLAKRLSGMKFDKIYSSDLERSKRTATFYSEEFVEDSRLREIYRVLVGGPIKEGTDPSREENDRNRADDFFEELVNEEGNIAVFAHGNIIRYFLNKIIGSDKDIWSNLFLDHCSVSIIERGEKENLISGINLKQGFNESIKNREGNVYIE